MPDIETQLKRYADAVESTYGPTHLSDPVELRPIVDQPYGRSPHRRRYAPMLAVAAVLIAVVGVWRIGGEQTTEVVTPAETDLTSTENDEDGYVRDDRGEDLEGQQKAGHPQLLPSPQDWVLTSATLSERPDSNVDLSDVWAFEHEDGRLSILVTSSPSENRQTLAESQIERQHNRVVMSWSEDDTQLALMTFDVDDQQLRTDAEQLSRTGDSYSLPGTVTLTGNERTGPVTGQLSTIVFSAISDGEPDTTRTIEQTAAPGTTTELFGTLFDASDLGVMKRLTVDGTTVYLMTSEFDGYGLSYIDGRVVTWQRSASHTDIAGFISSLSPVAVDEIDAAVEGAERLRQNAIDMAAANPPEQSRSGALPRFVLDSPWQLESVWDQSLWTVEQRAEYKVAMESASTGQVETGRIWYQYFAAGEAPDDALVELQAREATLSPATITVGSPNDQPITVLGYEGILGEFDGFRLISVRKGTTSLEIKSGRLTADELATFAERLIDRTGDGLAGFDLSDSDFTTIVEGAAPPFSDEPSPQTEFQRYNQQWTLDGMTVRVRVAEILPPSTTAWPPAEFAEAGRSAVGEPLPTPVSGTPFSLHNDGGWERLVWVNEPAGVTITIDGESDGLQRAARSIRTIKETEWQELAGPTAISFEEAIGFFLDPTRFSDVDEG